MFQSEELKRHLETSPTIRLQSLVVAEWNMNIASNILEIGNYRYRPNAKEGDADEIFANISSSFVLNDESNTLGATDADVVVDGGYESDEDEVLTPKLFISAKEKEKLLYSLDDCFGKFRPRSGINKMRWFPGRYTNHSDENIARRPRYYMADRYDKFKYWSSYRTENNVERGIANTVVFGQNFIDDAAPYVVYKEKVPANRIVVKMQTNVGDIDLGPFVGDGGQFNDPFFGDENKTTPINWKIQYLEEDNWIDVISFDANSTRRDGSAIVKSDGYLELFYGLVVPDEYRDVFVFSGEYRSETLLPEASRLPDGIAYLIKDSDESRGTIYISISGEYEQFKPEYGWSVEDEDVTNLTNYVTNLTSPERFIDDFDGGIKYREFQYVRGLRVVVETMNVFDSTFDLIELSPRLSVDLSDKTRAFTINKSASDLGVSGLPVGQLLASTGDIDIFDYDQAFFQSNVRDEESNTGSLVAKYTNQNIQFKFYEIIMDVDGFDYYVPIKTMYSEGFPEVSSTDRSARISLRDLFFYFESTTAPQLLIRGESVSYVISLLLDAAGFSNYTFLRVEGESEQTIPFFSVGPDTTLAQVLAEIAVSTQTAMFFDEYNNFVTMSKDYILPAEGSREADFDFILYGSKDFGKRGVVKNYYDNDKVIEEFGQQSLANIQEISSTENIIYNDGSINYTSRYIQRSFASIRQANFTDKDRSWIYKPSLLWEVSPSENTKPTNENVGQQSGYTLAAIPLNSDLSDTVPYVEDNEIKANYIDLGDGVYWLGRYNGYLYANGEIIRYDAVEYVVPGLGEGQDPNVWITSAQEYQRYFSKVPFNGKIFPTGRVRIYSEPNYEVVGGVTRLKNGPVAKHGRAQFGTGILGDDGKNVPVYHHAGLNRHWSSDANVRGVNMDFRFLADSSLSDSVRVVRGKVGVDNARARATTRNGIIKNFLANVFVEENNVNRMLTTEAGTIQSSALVMDGANTYSGESLPDFVTYVHKPLKDRYKHFGTRMRIVGKIENNSSRSQTPNGASTYYTAESASSDKSVAIGGAGGGIGIFVDSVTSNGYYFEISALTENNLESYEDGEDIHNVMFYKVMKRNAPSVAIQTKKLENNVATLTTTTKHSFLPGDKVVVSGVDSTFNSVEPHTIVSVTDTSFSYTKQAENVAQTDLAEPGKASILTDKAIPVKLWGGVSNIIVDTGLFTGQGRVAAEENPTVYDLSVEYEKIGKKLRFYLYINNVLIKYVDDPTPLPIINSMALFIRGTSRVMFENVYAMTKNYSQNTTFDLDIIPNSAFGTQEISAANSFQKYALSGLIQSTYLSGISTSEPPKYKIYFEEFGTIMREAAYFNVRYDKAYPALYAKIAPTFNRLKGYTISGFSAGAYSADFLVFNATDSTLNLDSTTGNYLRILGVTFTQESTHELTVDEFFSKKSDTSNPEFYSNGTVRSPEIVSRDYQDIKFSRLTNGRKQFSITAPYIQTQDDAESLMSWLSSKIMKPRKSIGVKIFATPTIQLGDVVKVDYKNADGVDEVAGIDSRFVVYSIEYSRDGTGPNMLVYLSEVTQ